MMWLKEKESLHGSGAQFSESVKFICALVIVEALRTMMTNFQAKAHQDMVTLAQQAQGPAEGDRQTRIHAEVRVA